MVLLLIPPMARVPRVLSPAAEQLGGSFLGPRHISLVALCLRGHFFKLWPRRLYSDGSQLRGTQLRDVIHDLFHGYVIVFNARHRYPYGDTMRYLVA